MNYKKIFKDKEKRLKLLKFLKFIPNKLMLKIQYRIKIGKHLNLNHPKTYTEKLQWYKLNYKDPLMTKCADKHTVREYLEERGYGYLSCKEYGIYNDPNEMCLNDLPEKFVIKTTNGSGTNIICKDKSQFKLDETVSTLREWLKRDCYGLAREWAYKDIKPRILVEELLEDSKNKFEGINDYKFICFGGKVHYVVLDVDRFVGHRRNIYDSEWNYIDVETDCGKIGDIIPKPEGFEEMKKIAEELSKDFPSVRVDLYWVNHRVYFGELTFYPWAGYVVFRPEEFDRVLGENFVLPKPCNKLCSK